MEDGKGRVKQKDVSFGATRMIALVLQRYAINREIEDGQVLLTEVFALRR